MTVRHLTIEVGDEGVLEVVGSKTIDRYRQLRKMDSERDCYSYGVFFAFSNEQFEQGKRRARIADGERIVHAGAGLYGTAAGIGQYLATFRETDRIIARECDAQEIYLYEYNNHECMYSFCGDLDAIRIIIGIYGSDVARAIHRYRAYEAIDTIVDKYIRNED